MERITKELPKGLLSWYSFRKDSKILYFGKSDDAVALLLYETCGELICSVDSVVEEVDTYDYIVAVGILEYAENHAELLQGWNRSLKENGTILIGANNRLGLRYFCGDSDVYTNRTFDGIENYRRATDTLSERRNGHAYSKVEITALLEEAGILHHKFYSVLPNLEMPQLIYADHYLPEEELAGRYSPIYNTPNTVFLEEECLYTDMIKNGLFHTLANSFLIECTKAGIEENVLHVTISTDRGREQAIATIIRSDDTVEKRMLYPEGKERIRGLADNTEYLAQQGLTMIHGRVESNSYYMPYVKGVDLVSKFRELFYRDQGAFLCEMDKYRDCILQSSHHVRVDEKYGVILERGYVDLIPLNCIDVNGTYHFFDQEVYYEEYPVNVILYRAIVVIYSGEVNMNQTLPIEVLFERYRLLEELVHYRKLANQYMKELRNTDELALFWNQYKRTALTVHSNRQKINYSVLEYQRIFCDIFKGVEKKKIILFGSGEFTKTFLARYQRKYKIYKIIDNNKEKWNTYLDGIIIENPAILKQYEQNEIHIIICIKNYVNIVKQLQELGIEQYCIYDTNMTYSTYTILPPEEKVESVQKKYKKGYISGVFDLFHVGHLNLLKRAKEQCEYLIVGVVTEEGVRKYKETEPIIPFAERLAIVEACKYVDEAVEIPLEYAGTQDAYRMYEFDCQFSGSDYVNNTGWMVQREFLREQGSDMVFFPYTEGTSSTKLKETLHQMEKKDENIR